MHNKKSVWAWRYKNKYDDIDGSVFSNSTYRIRKEILQTESISESISGLFILNLRPV